MKLLSTERAILIAFLGSYLVNNVAAAFAVFVPAGTSGKMWNAQYITFILLAAVTIAIVTWWYLRPLPKAQALMAGLAFGILGFLVAVVTSFITGVAGVLLQTGSLSTLAQVLPNFWPFLMSWATLILLLDWIIPATIVGWMLQPRRAPVAPTI